MKLSFCLLVLGVFVLAMPAPVFAHECSIYNIYRPNDLQKGRSLSVGVFGVEGHNTTPDKMRVLQRFGADRLRTEIGKLQYFSSVQVTEEPGGDGSDLHLTATVANLDEGSKWRRALARTGAAKVRVTGAVRTKSGEQVFDYECEGAEVGGGIGGFGGLVGNFVDGLFAAFDSSESLLRKSFEKFAEDFAKNIKDVDADRQKLLKGNSKKRAVSAGMTVRETKVWRQRARSDWTPTDHSKEVDAFVVETQNKDWFRVHALWLGESAYASNIYLNTVELGDGKVEFADGLLPDLTPARALLDKPEYLIGVTFESGASDGRTDGHEGPFVWDDSAVLKATYLVRKGQPALTFAASDAVRLPAYLQRRGSFGVRWRNVPVVFAFPAVSANGTALVQSLTDEIELHTTIGDRPAVATFRLADLELTDVKDLQRRR